jgi:hypothetical protein
MDLGSSFLFQDHGLLDIALSVPENYLSFTCHLFTLSFTASDYTTTGFYAASNEVSLNTLCQTMFYSVLTHNNQHSPFAEVLILILTIFQAY